MDSEDLDFPEPDWENFYRWVAFEFRQKSGVELTPAEAGSRFRDFLQTGRVWLQKIGMEELSDLDLFCIWFADVDEEDGPEVFDG